jgi:hypothetical protein
MLLFLDMLGYSPVFFLPGWILTHAPTAEEFVQASLLQWAFGTLCQSVSPTVHNSMHVHHAVLQ